MLSSCSSPSSPPRPFSQQDRCCKHQRPPPTFWDRLRPGDQLETAVSAPQRAHGGGRGGPERTKLRADQKVKQTGLGDGPEGLASLNPPRALVLCAVPVPSVRLGLQQRARFLPRFLLGRILGQSELLAIVACFCPFTKFPSSGSVLGPMLFAYRAPLCSGRPRLTR